MSDNIIQRIQRSVINRGMVETISTVWTVLLNRILHRETTAKHQTSLPSELNYLLERRIKLGSQLNNMLGGVIKYGPFTGLRLSPLSYWGASDRASMLLGLYEREILDRLERIPITHDVLIDVGAADGYYALGLLASGKTKHSYCFEASEVGQQVIQANALLNGLSSAITVLGIADSNFPSLLARVYSVDLARCLVIVDVEGAEFEILTRTVFQELAGSFLVIELHMWMQNADEQVSRMLHNCLEWYEVEFLTTTARDLSTFPEISNWPDDDRWILCSEGRRRQPKWLFLTPV